MTPTEQDKLREQIHKLFGDHQADDGGYQSCYDGKWIDMTNEVCEVADFIIADRRRVGLEAIKVTGDTSDGYHTFNELYDYRRVYNAALFNEWASQGKYDVHKSWKHSDGEDCFGGGWFIVVAELPTGQVSNHYEAQYWDNFVIPSKDIANEYDGHTPKQALERIAELKSQQEEV